MAAGLVSRTWRIYESPGPGEYVGAARAAFSYPAPGLDVFGNGRGCNTVTGRFTVLESVYDNGRAIRRERSANVIHISLN